MAVVRYAASRMQLPKHIVPDNFPFELGSELTLHQPNDWKLLVDTLDAIEKKTPAQWRRSDREFLEKDEAVTNAMDELLEGYEILHRRGCDLLAENSTLYTQQKALSKLRM